MKDQAVKLKGEDVKFVREIKREMSGLPTARLIGAALFGWRFLTTDQKMAALNRGSSKSAASATS